LWRGFVVEGIIIVINIILWITAITTMFSGANPPHSLYYQPDKQYEFNKLTMTYTELSQGKLVMSLRGEFNAESAEVLLRRSFSFKKATYYLVGLTVNTKTGKYRAFANEPILGIVGNEFIAGNGSYKTAPDSTMVLMVTME
jgi:hypothetical protein